MPRFQTRYDGKSLLRLKVDIHGNIRTLEALVDTGFVSGAGFGIKLPLSYLRYVRRHGTGRVITATDELVEVAMIPDAKIVGIEDESLESEIPIPACFLGASSAIGVLFLQRCICIFDGPNRQLTINLG